MKPGDTTPQGTVKKIFPFKSKTDPSKSYECVLYTNNSTTCNCRGWVNARNGRRSCKHTEMVEGQLDGGHATQVFTGTAIANAPASRPPIGGRRFNLDA